MVSLVIVLAFYNRFKLSNALLDNMPKNWFYSISIIGFGKIGVSPYPRSQIARIITVLLITPQ